MLPDDDGDDEVDDAAVPVMLPIATDGVCGTVAEVSTAELIGAPAAASGAAVFLSDCGLADVS